MSLPELVRPAIQRLVMTWCISSTSRRRATSRSLQGGIEQLEIRLVPATVNTPLDISDPEDGLTSLYEAIEEVNEAQGGVIHIGVAEPLQQLRPFNTIRYPVTVSGILNSSGLYIDANLAQLRNLTLIDSQIFVVGNGSIAEQVTLNNGGFVFNGGNNSASFISGSGTLELRGGNNNADHISLTGGTEDGARILLEGDMCTAEEISITGVVGIESRFEVSGDFATVSDVTLNNARFVLTGDAGVVQALDGAFPTSPIPLSPSIQFNGNEISVTGVSLINGFAGFYGNDSIISNVTAFSQGGGTTKIELPGSNNSMTDLTIDGGDTATASLTVGNSISGNNNTISEMLLKHGDLRISGSQNKLFDSEIDGGRVVVSFASESVLLGNTLRNPASSQQPQLDIAFSDHSVVENNSVAGMIKVGNQSPGTIFKNNQIHLDPNGLDPNRPTIALSIGSNTNGTEIRNNKISGYTDGIGIQLFGGRDHIIAGNQIGFDQSGNRNGGQIGLKVIGTGPVVIGGPESSDRNTISGNSQVGILLETSDNVIENNYIGINLAGNQKVPNGTGMDIGGGRNVIRKNVIAGNNDIGLDLSGDDHTVTGNSIGTNLNGAGNLGNGGDGIRIRGDNNQIGGGTQAARNIISGNLQTGVYIQYGSENKVQGNHIGTGIDGNSPLGNGMFGVYISNASQTVIGAPVDSDVQSLGNRIAFSGQQDAIQGDGIAIAFGNRNTIRMNHIFKNEGLGIDRGDDFFDRLDPLQLGTPANNALWRPTIISVNGDTIRWMLNVPQSATYTVDIYSDPENARTEYAEGATWLTSLNPTFIHGHFEFETTVGKTNITATATDELGNTSEFSLADEDADGLCDTWEANAGIDLHGTGNLDVELEDADVLRKDLYVQFDSMIGWAPINDGSTNDVLERIRTVFAAHDIVIHIEAGNQSISPAHFGSKDINAWTSFHEVKGENFADGSDQFSDAYQAKLLAYRYCVFGITHDGTTSSGRGEILGNDFMVTLGGWFGQHDDGTFRTASGHRLTPGGAKLVSDLQAGTFLHELGHTLGLQHVGPQNWDGSTPPDGSLGVIEYDPDYVSVMNYIYQAPGGEVFVGPQILNYSTTEPDEWHNLWFAFQEHPQSRANGDQSTAPNIETDSYVHSTATLEITSAGANKAEGNAGNTAYTFTVTRVGDTNGILTVQFLVSGSGETPAAAADFGGTFPSGTITFSPNQTEITLTIQVTGDVTNEPDEEFTVTLSDPVPVVDVVTSTAIGVIVNDESTPPVLAFSSSDPVQYQLARKAIPTAIDAAAALTIGASSPNYVGAKLVVSIVANLDSKDVLGLLPGDSGGIQLKGRKLLHGGDVLGTISGGKRRTPDLTITFTGVATPELVEKTLRKLSFSTKGGAAKERTVQIRLINVAGQSSNAPTRTVRVN